MNEEEREQVYHLGTHESDLAVLKNYNKELKDETSELVELIKSVARKEGKEEAIRAILEGANFGAGGMIEICYAEDIKSYAASQGITIVPNE